MELIMELFSPEDQLEMKKLYEMGIPQTEKSQLWGYEIIPGFSAEAAEYAYEKWNLREGDVIVASYPKTGTLWMAEIVRHLVYGKEKNGDALVRQLPGSLRIIEYGGDKKFDLLDKLPTKRRCIFTHLPADLINFEKIKEAKAKVVCMLRNPKDQMVSWYNFIPEMPQGKTESWKQMLKSGWNKYFEHVVAGDFEMNSKPGEWYPEYILSWYKHKNNKTVSFVHFEDLKKNNLETIKQVAKFLEVDLADAEANHIMENTSLQALKEKSKRTADIELRKFQKVHLNKGGVGGWKDYFTVRQSERIDEIIKEKLKNTDIKFKYEI